MNKKTVIYLLISVIGLSFYINGIAEEKKKKVKKSKKIITIPNVSRDKVICFALYTVQDDILKLTAQLYPLKDGEDRHVRLEIRQGSKWKEISKVKISEEPYGVDEEDTTKSWTAHFRIEKWDMTRTYQYRICHGEKAEYEGIIRKDPTNKKVISVAGFTGNSNKNRDQRDDIIKNIKIHDPDMLFFSGDQSYDHKSHLAAWLLFGKQFGEIIKDRPTICLPDDHDVGQGNIWGEGGKKASSAKGSDGGFYYPVQYVNQVQYAQTSHMPDPYDPTPIQRGITVYYTDMVWGGISFAIIEDRKWKSGPAGKVPKTGPRADHIKDSEFDTDTLDLPGLKLLGDRQLEFLEKWTRDWDNAYMKATLSQTVFANAAHMHGGRTKRLHADLDSNGWPQTGRRKALEKIRKGFAFMYCGDQHLGTVIHHGIEQWGDSGYSFSVPSIVNHYGRWWHPLEKAENPIQGPLEYTGDYRDGFRNRVSMKAYIVPQKENYSGVGYGLVLFNKETRKITMECWGRNIDVSLPETKQYPGWPVVIDQLDNYGRKAVAYLPEVVVEGKKDQVIQVIKESDQSVVYTVRMNGSSFQPKIFDKESKYSIKVGELNGKFIKKTGLNTVDSPKLKSIKIKL
jgi:hypothetical protein